MLEEKQERGLTSESSLRVNDITGSASFEHGFASGRSFVLSSMNSRSLPFHRILETPSHCHQTDSVTSNDEAGSIGDQVLPPS